MSNILDEAKSHILAKRRYEEDKLHSKRLEEEQSYRDAIYAAVEILGGKSPRINLVLARVYPEKPLFRTVYDGLIITNSDSNYANLIDIADLKHTDRIAQFNTVNQSRQDWLDRIATLLVEPYMDQEGA